MLFQLTLVLFLASSSLAAAVSSRAPDLSIRRKPDPQTSHTLDPRVISTAWENDGAASGATPSITSGNNFINWCLTTGLPLMNGTIPSVATCNPVPQGAIPSPDRMPSVKFVHPPNLGTLPAGQTFVIQLAVRQLHAGLFGSATTNWYGAPQQLDADGLVMGHTHFIIEALESYTQTTPNDPTQYAFFAAVSAPAVNGVISQNVTNGLPAGVYKLSSMNAAMNHQPVVVGIPNHASLDDTVYFTVA
ncbi:hypothetical protein K488DRAFT_87375 [Vararia minispora EC-137]|uniref:Uncharacterized protein n=1 Tax=Vararia minispora EC-137 TaxID=1314806 RepID=A0ACB8QGE8_9AGAM|nr:hypothetical protein K488DRAFT_87375 [Vararia minispora EC-137]